jgi:hypothetical protein
MGGRVGPRTGLDDVEKRKISPLPGLELRHFGVQPVTTSVFGIEYFY